MRFNNKKKIFINGKELILDYLDRFYTKEEADKIIKDNNGSLFSTDDLAFLKKNFLITKESKFFIKEKHNSIKIELKLSGVIDMDTNNNVYTNTIYIQIGNSYYLSKANDDGCIYYGDNFGDYKLLLMFLR